MLKVSNILLILFLVTNHFFCDGQSKTVNVSDATITWKGNKIVGGHEGKINLKKGLLVLNGEEIKGGTFIVDMNSINTTDLEGQGKRNLDTHLKSDDFFNSSKYPEAVLKFIKIQKKSPDHYYIKANLNIKGINKPVYFDLYTNSGRKANAALKIDRTAYGINYGSGSFFDNLGDYAIDDKFDLTITFKY